ncbi:hypothetical protein QCA50_005274 [Cerrena zonata]|uniref:Uncharacterized protein n=1 Tax=Cerrena zonata TaxID=2478898 RepID=A0AAW0GRI6_9APHY
MNINQDAVRPRSRVFEGNWEFLRNGAAHVGAYRKKVESGNGDRLLLQFADGTTTVKPRSECTKTSNPVTDTAPPT